MGPLRVWGAMLLLLIAASDAHAFSPAVHRALAERAAILEGIPPEAAERFAWGAVDEDWNVARKWSTWHHYHSPSYAPVRSLWRKPSAGRVASLEEEIRAAVTAGNADRAWLLAGQLAHHVQDMASPPHVVPVAHGLTDGFERYVTTRLVAATDGAEVPDLDLAAAHQHLAEATMAALAVPLVCDTQTMDWDAFWEPHDGTFGAYGSAGNRFGGVAGCEVGTRSFALDRLDDALAYTRGVVRAVAGVTAPSLIADAPR